MQQIIFWDRKGLSRFSCVSALMLALVVAGLVPLARGEGVATTQEAIDSGVDLWGEAAMRQPGGPTYEFFEKLLPPLRYVDADFRYYPIVLSAPTATVKGRILSNGSQINALARQPNWTNESGIPIHVFVGPSRRPFGADPTRLTGPQLEQGWLPIISLACEEEGERYGLRAFAAVTDRLASSGGLVVRLQFPAADRGKIELRIESGSDYLEARDGLVRNSTGKVLLAYDKNWAFNKARSALLSEEKHAAIASVIVFTEPGAATGGHPQTRSSQLTDEPEAQTAQRIGSSSQPAVNAELCDREEQLARNTWQELLDRGMKVSVPEGIVNDAWRALIVQQHEIISGEHMNYSASNQYARKYANESGDSMRSLALWGHTHIARRVLPPIFVYRRPQSVLHDAGFKLEDLADYYFLTRDRKLIEEMRPLWQREIDLIVSSLEAASGLLPRERYCSDIETPIISLNNNANCWRGLRDMSLILAEMGEREQAQSLAETCRRYRKAILAAMDKWTVHNVDPPFIPIALGGEEPVHHPITQTRLGSYWNLVVPCVLWSGVFPIDSEPATNIIRTIQEKGGLCMGLTRVQSVRGAWRNTQNIDDLYVIRYALALLRRDDVDRALVTFYGKLAQGFTRDTFMDGESTGIEPLDPFGRQLALPPNSTANASFLMQLRYLLIQDWDMDDDGAADTLRLAFATPRSWLADRGEILVERAPTAFGEVSMRINSDLAHGRITAVLDLPERSSPAKTLLRLRVPHTQLIQSIHVDGSNRSTAGGTDTIDLTGLHGHITVQAQVNAVPQ